jgi:hypothetical protein
LIAFNRIAITIILAWAFIYTTSYARWTWKKKNKLGGLAIFIVALAVIIVPAWTIYRLER